MPEAVDVSAADVSWLALLVLAADLAIRIGLGLRIVMRCGSVPVTLAWLVPVLLVPFVGAGFYLLVGETRLGGRRVEAYRRVVNELEAARLALWRHRASDWPEDQRPYRHLERIVADATGLPPMGGNAVRLVSGPREAIDALVEDVAAAERRVHLLFYIWMTGGVGDRLADAVMDAARRGVACRVLVDAVGSRPFLTSATCRRMRNAGVEVRTALPAGLWRLPFARVDLRNHRKIAVIDGRIGWAGSANVTDETFNVSRRPGVGPWVEAMARVEGPAAGGLEFCFVSDWRLEARGRPARVDPERLVEEASSVPSAGGSIVQVLPSGPGDAPGAAHDALLAAIYAADRELVMTTPYFVPDEALRIALRAAAQRGVDVTLVLPKKLDQVVVAMAARSHLDEMLDAGIRIRRYTGGLLHAKTVTVDRHFALIGSANFDNRSFQLNFEITLLVHDSDVASTLAWVQKDYLSMSEPLEAAEWKARPVGVRVVENVARLLGPVL